MVRRFDLAEFPSRRPLPLYITAAIVALLVFGFINSRRIRRRDEERGWRVGRQGRDQLLYDKLREGKWERIDVDGAILEGTPHHVIYLSSTVFPLWGKSARKRLSSASRASCEHQDTNTKRHDPNANPSNATRAEKWLGPRTVSLFSYQRKCANARLACAILCMSSRFLIALPWPVAASLSS